MEAQSYGGTVFLQARALGKPTSGAAGDLRIFGRGSVRDQTRTFAGASQPPRVCPKTLYTRITATCGNASAPARVSRTVFVAVVSRYREPTPQQAWEVDPEA